MAKQIKAIKCPHCGSVNKTKLDKDLYHCENCNTDYFLDNDDININIHNKTTIEKGFEPANILKNKPLVIGVGGIVGAIFLFIVINALFNKPAPRQYGTYSGSSSTSVPKTVVTPTKPVEPVKVVDKPIKYSQYSKVYYTYLTKNNQAYSFNIVYRLFDQKQSELNGIYYEVRDVLTGKLVKKAPLQKSGHDDNWYFRRFDNGVTYIVYGDSTVYAFDEQDLNVVNVTQSLFKDHPEFVSGIATVNLTPWGYEDSFYILTNNGQEYFFYPLLNKIYNYNSDYDELRKYALELNNRREKVIEPYTRTSYRFEKINGDLTLVKVVYKTTNISKFDSFGLSSISNSDKPYKINLQYGQGPIIEDKILAKDRLFFSPSVVYGTKDKLIIRVKNNAAPNAYYNLQSLDVNTGEVNWTIKGNEELDFWSSSSSDGTLSLWNKYNLESKKLFIPYSDGYLVQLDYGRYVVITKQGEISNVIKYQQEPIFAKAAN